LKSSVGGAVAENSSTPVEAPPTDARTQETRKSPILLRSQLHRNLNQLRRPTSKPEITQGESSSKNNSGGAMYFAALINKPIEEFRNMLFSSQQ